MGDGQAWTPEPRREKTPASNMALLLWGLRSPARCPLSWLCAYRGKFIGQVGEHSFRGQKSWVFPQLVKITQKDEFIALTPGPGILQGFIHHSPCCVAPF